MNIKDDSYKNCVAQCPLKRDPSKKSLIKRAEKREGGKRGIGCDFITTGNRHLPWRVL